MEGRFINKAFVEDSISDGLPPPPKFGDPVNMMDRAPRTQYPTAKIASLEFGLMKTSDTLRLSQLQIVNREYYELTKQEPVKYGPLDKRMGISSKTGECETCHRKLADCVGHFGHVHLVLPVFHIGYVKECIRVLQAICKECARVLLTPDQRELYLKRIRQPNLDRRRKANVAKVILSECKKKRRCPYCGAHNGVVKKLTGAFRIVHELRHKDAADAREEFLESFDTAVLFTKGLKEHLSKATHDLNPLVVQRLFERVLDEDCDLLYMDRIKGRPEDMLVTDMIVPPVAIRPSVNMGSSGSNEDDLTVKISDIVQINKLLRSAIEQGQPTPMLAERWDFLQAQVAMYVNSDQPGFPKVPGQKPIRALTQRLKGKAGRFRGNLSGKRVDFSGRTVISPDPNLRIDQVGIPVRVAKVLTYPERVTPHNIEVLRQAVRNGPNVHPGANFVEHPNGTKTYLMYGDPERIAGNLKYGDVVERHLRDDDVVLFNRQPSLHKMSIMAHKAKVLEWRTFRFNECVCTPYNADFDGDEMNIHLPQTEEARAEALLLMGVTHNLVTSRHGEPLVAATQDFLTSAYLISQKDVFYDRAEFCAMVCYLNDANEAIEMPPPVILKPMQLWTGKQIFNMLLRPNSSGQWPLLNLELKERNYERNEFLCPRDGYVLIRNSELLAGNLGKSTLGGSKTGMYYALIRDHSPEVSAACMNRLAKLSSRWIGTRGFSIGVTDVTPSSDLQLHKKQLLSKGYATCSENINQWKMGRLQASPGCDEEQTLEAVCLGELSNIREDLGSYCLKELDYHHNSPLIMAICGSKGSKINISQMVACVGQQAVNGSRIPEGFVNRTLPHFHKFSREPEAKGFVENSFYTGLTATEFFFHTMGGREGLVDTAVKTAETGYMQRRLMKALEDLTVHYDLTVRASDKTVVQFAYGDDSLDPVMMMEGIKPVVFQRVWDAVRATDPCPNQKALTTLEFEAIFMKFKQSFDYEGELSGQFRVALEKFLDDKMAEMQMLLSDLVNASGPKPFDRKTAQSLIGLYARITKTQLQLFLQECREKYKRALVEPGTAVGAIAGQSIGEPGTQMTLKTFHFAGVASMNITQGVPRIREIINASKSISSPIISVPLVNSKDIKSARIVKARLERTTLGDVAEYIEVVYSPGQCYLSVKLDLEAIEALQLNITVDDVTRAIVLDKKLKVKDGVRSKGADMIRIYPSDTRKESMMYNMHAIKLQLPNVIVKGFPSVARAVINKAKGDELQLVVEGEDLRAVMGVNGVNGRECKANHVLEVERVLGIEAARRTIIDEMSSTFDHHGLTVDPRHMALLGDVMSYRGEILGITRFGVAKMKDSVLMLASFEKTSDHLFEAALRGVSDAIAGVSECIIMGVPIPLGTGLFQLVQQVHSDNHTLQQLAGRSLLLSHEDHRLDIMV